MMKTIRSILALALPSLVIQSVAQCPDYTGYSQASLRNLELVCGLTAGRLLATSWRTFEWPSEIALHAPGSSLSDL